MIEKGTHIMIIDPHTGVVLRGRAHNTELAGYQTARIDHNTYRLLLVPEREGIEWVRGWSVKKEKALLVAAALSP